MIKAGIVGATGYAGEQLLWLLINHKDVEVKFISSNSYKGEKISDLYGNYRGRCDMECIGMDEVKNSLDDVDVVFIALPHGKSAPYVKMVFDKGIKVIDLGADYRLDSMEEFTYWYGIPYAYPELKSFAVYGLPELRRKDIIGKRLVANPGCNATAAILSTYPLMKAGLIEADSLVIDVKTGVSGAGRGAKTATLYCEVNETAKPYAVATHRHTAEIEQELGRPNGDIFKMSFVPHLVPMNRGILATSYSTLKKGVKKDEVIKAYKDCYESEKFIRFIDDIPETRWVKNSNFTDVSVRIDDRTGKVIAMAALDNLMKGAASAAVQNMNILFGLDEETGIDMISMFP